MNIDERVLIDGKDVFASWRPVPFRPEPDEVRQVAGVCFVERNVLLVQTGDNALALPGGKPEPGETFELAVSDFR